VCYSLPTKIAQPEMSGVWRLETPRKSLGPANKITVALQFALIEESSLDNKSIFFVIVNGIHYITYFLYEFNIDL